MKILTCFFTRTCLREFFKQTPPIFLFFAWPGLIPHCLWQKDKRPCPPLMLSGRRFPNSPGVGAVRNDKTIHYFYSYSIVLMIHSPFWPIYFVKLKNCFVTAETKVLGRPFSAECACMSFKLPVVCVHCLHPIRKSSLFF